MLAVVAYSLKLGTTRQTANVKARANGRNIVGQKPPATRNNVVTCCVRLHGPLRLPFDVYVVRNQASRQKGGGAWVAKRSTWWDRKRFLKK